MDLFWKYVTETIFIVGQRTIEFAKRNQLSVISGAVVVAAARRALQQIFLAYKDRLLLDQPVFPSTHAPASEFHHRRYLTYPGPITNTWYHLCDSCDLQVGQVLEVRALGQVFALWRTQDGTPVCQDAFCIHLGANLTSGGKVVDDCLECPFHRWKFAKDGSVAEIPYLPNPKQCSITKQLKTFRTLDWCGMVFVYFHAENEEPAFSLPQFVVDEFKSGGWVPHMKWNAGLKTFHIADFVDQAGDHSHFNLLHADFVIPWTTFQIPEFLIRMFPLRITHTLRTFRGDDKDWAERVEASKVGIVDKHFIFFTDKAGLTWNGQVMESTISETLEMYCGPSLLVFHIPFTIGKMKVFLTITPTESCSVIVRVKTWIDGDTSSSLFKRCIAWALAGIAASQLASDIKIMESKIRLTKPTIQPLDGPYNRTNNWLKQFYSPNSPPDDAFRGYKNDW